MEKIKIGIIGCGNISNAYFNASKKFEIIEVKSCADINSEAAAAKAEEHGVSAVTVDEMLADPEIEIVINLTIPKAHVEVSMKCLEAGKHVHLEKPLGINYEEGRKLVEFAKSKGLLIGCAPDTFLGGGQQTCRKLIDDGWIGRPIAGTAIMMGRGPEPWHPNPGFFYEEGGGPMLDMGPYYMTALVNMLGPAKSIRGFAVRSFDERVAGHESIKGKKIPVMVPTHYSGSIEFHSGAIISVIISFDVYGHHHKPIEIYGTNGSLTVPDPNTFGGEVQVKVARNDWQNVGFTHGYTENMRSIGVADMACALRSGRKHRCSGELALHVLEIMTGFRKASENGGVYELETTCDKPAALPLGLMDGFLDSFQ
ncbi:MAG: Gfo/Idh/MocA family oxidoreductase [Victivallales bacterium]|nr:Gfo/Idh/MocA family oxidoreductase [Victivallales bacterium]